MAESTNTQAPDEADPRSQPAVGRLVSLQEIVAAAVKAGFTRVKESANDVAHLRRPAHLERTYSLTVSDVGLGYIEVILTSDSPETIATQNAVRGWG